MTKKQGGRRYQPKHIKESVAEEVLSSEPEAVEEQEEEQPKRTPEEHKAWMKSRRERGKLQSLATEGDLVDIWERRLLNPHHSEALPIRVKTPGMRLRWINLKQPGRFQRARYEQGWVPVHKDELVDEREIYGVSFTSEGFVCRGEKQTEMLMKIPVAVYKKIQQRIAELNMQSYKKLRQNLGAAGYQHFKEKRGGSAGDQAEEIANSFKGSVKFGTEKVSSDELFE